MLDTLTTTERATPLFLLLQGWPLFQVKPSGFPTIIHKKIDRRCVWASRRAAMRLVRYGGELECLRLGTPLRLGPTADQRARGGSLDRRAASIGSTTFATISL